MSTSRSLFLVVLFPTILVGQQQPLDPSIDVVTRSSLMEKLVSMIEAGYVVPQVAEIAVRRLQSAQSSGAYDGVNPAKTLADKLTADLRSPTHDKHIAVYYDPQSSTPARSAGPEAGRHTNVSTLGSTESSAWTETLGTWIFGPSRTSTKVGKRHPPTSTRLRTLTQSSSTFARMAAATHPWSPML